MVDFGGIVSVGGFGGGSSGSSSGILSINSQTGPAIVINGANGIGVITGTNVITIDGASLSGLIGSGPGSQSGVVGVNGIDVQQVGGSFVVDGAALSGLIQPSGGIGGINGQIGPHIELQGVNGADVIVVDENSIIIDVSSLSGVIPSPDGSGINAVNGDTGPNIDLVGVNGIEVTAVGGGTIVIDGAGASGTLKFAASFTNVVSGQFTHNLGTRDVVVQIYEESPLAIQIIPDRIIRDTPDTVSVLFNRAQSGRVVIVG